MIKRLSLVSRAAWVDPHEFAGRWRADALDVLTGAPEAVRPLQLGHCVVRHGRMTPPHDGMAIAWFADADAAAAHDRWTESRTNTALDHHRSEHATVDARCVVGDERLRSRWGTPETATEPMLIGFIERLPTISRDDFGRHWWTRHRPLANELTPPDLQPWAYVHDYPVADDPFRWDGVGEMYEVSLDVARDRGDWFASGEAASLIEDEERFLVRATRMILVADHEVVVPGTRF